MPKSPLIFLVLLSSCLAQLSRAETIPAFAKNYADGLLTGDYGIITEEDLAVEAWNAVTGPFDLNRSDGYNRWQCFPVKDVKPEYDTWRDSDGMGPSNIIVTMCTLDTRVEHDGQVQIYSGRRAYQINYCRNYMRAWKKLTRGEKVICLSGQYSGIGETESKGGKTVSYKRWTWDKIKSKKGCYAYFGGDCQVYIDDWKKAGSPRPKK